MPTTNAFEVLNTEVTPTCIEDMEHQHEVVPSSMANINTELGIEVRPSAPYLGTTPSMTDFNTETGKSIRTTSESDQTPSHHFTVSHQVTLWANAFGDSDDEPDNDDYADDIAEDEWPPLQGEGSSKPSNEFDHTPYVGQHSNIKAIVLFDSSGALTTVQRNLNLVASQPSVSETTNQNLWNLVKRKSGRPKKEKTVRRMQLSTSRLGLTKPFTRASRHTTN
ncbi:hypothetical protein FNV43_RR09813 [Rhamnella rubrinervis]|uniref:Uncharacterized protein n=1 Tax=Rhamnella rubrinervis TaxID=2594499 RepID=A0A8K0MK50_9ROSA|nr:hypothetical protein FNV43_RR09813 [Rhamnella rubrinervis]